MRLAIALFAGALAYAAVFVAVAYFSWGVVSVLACHRWGDCIEVNPAAGYAYMILGVPALLVAAVLAMVAAVTAFVLLRRKFQRANSN